MTTATLLADSYAFGKSEQIGGVLTVCKYSFSGPTLQSSSALGQFAYEFSLELKQDDLPLFVRFCFN